MSRSPKSIPKSPPAPEASGSPSPPEGRHESPASAFSVIRLEDLHETERLKSDLVAVYQPANSQELAALERMAIAHQSILRTSRLEAGLCASAMNEFCDGRGDLTLMLNAQFVGDGDIEITHAQNRNLAFAEGFQRMVSRSGVWTVFLRYQAQAERNYRRAVEEHERVRKLRGQLPNHLAPAPGPNTHLEAPPLPGSLFPASEPARETTPTTSAPSPRPPARISALRRHTVRQVPSPAGWRPAFAAVVFALIAWSAAFVPSASPATRVDTAATHLDQSVGTAHGALCLIQYAPERNSQMPKKIDPLNKKNYGAVTAALCVTNVKAAAGFYQKAFGFQKRGIMNGPDGKPMHAELALRGTSLMLGPEMPEMGARSAKNVGASPTTLYLLVENVDQVVAKAIKLGAQAQGPVSDMFWGDRCGRLIDPEGYTWYVATHTADPTPAQMRKQMTEEMKQWKAQREAAATAAANPS